MELLFRIFTLFRDKQQIVENIRQHTSGELKGDSAFSGAE
jgi:hypothetical protein